MTRSRMRYGPTMGFERTTSGTTEKLGTLVENSQLNVSSGHYGYPRFPKNRDIGGTFITQGTRIINGYQDVGEIYRGGVNDQSYTGQVYAYTLSSALPSPPTTDGYARGAEAYKRMKPTKPLFNIDNYFYELKDMPGLILDQMKSRHIHTVSNFHLAVQFGWLPLLSDIRSLVKTQQGMAKRIRWLLEHNGKPVRKKVILTETESDPIVSTGSSISMLQPVFVSQYYKGTPKYTTVTTTGERYWATAQFRYWLPPGPRDIDWTRRMIMYLYGSTPTPSVIYNMIPWTWLADYFANIGDLIENLDTGVADRLAADRFYVMREHWSRLVVNVDANFVRRNGEPVHVTSVSQRDAFFKSRIKGNPFGLQANLDLSPTQLSILGALGLSRL